MTLLVNNRPSEENRKILVSLGSCIVHHPELYEALRKSLGDWAAKPGPRCGVDEMHQSGDLRPQAASDFVRLLTERGVTAAVYCIPDERVHQLVIRVLFAERPCIDERVAVGDAMADLLDLHLTLSVDLMTLDSREVVYCPLPEYAVSWAHDESATRRPNSGARCKAAYLPPNNLHDSDEK